MLKLTAKEAEKDKAMFGEKGTATDVVATLEFEPPTHVRWSRFDASGKTSFITAFYCSPAGANLTYRAPCGTSSTALYCFAPSIYNTLIMCDITQTGAEGSRIIALQVQSSRNCLTGHLSI